MDHLTELEALHPDSSLDYIEYAGRRIQLKPITLATEIQILKLAAPLLDSTSFDILEGGTSGIATAMSRLSENVDSLVKMAEIILNGWKIDITEAQLLDTPGLTVKETQEFVLAVLKKYLSIGVPVADFFTKILDGGRMTTETGIEMIESVMTFALAIRSSDSQEPTNGSLPQSSPLPSPNSSSSSTAQSQTPQKQAKPKAKGKKAK